MTKYWDLSKIPFNAVRSFYVHFESIIPAYFPDILLYFMLLPSSYTNPPCYLNKLK